MRASLHSPPRGPSCLIVQDSRSLAPLAAEFEAMLQTLQSTFSTSATIYRAPSLPDGGGGAATPAIGCLVDAANTAAAHTASLCHGMHAVLVQMERLPRHAAAASSLRASLSGALAECSRLDAACGCAPRFCFLPRSACRAACGPGHLLLESAKHLSIAIGASTHVHRIWVVCLHHVGLECIADPLLTFFLSGALVMSAFVCV